MSDQSKTQEQQIKELEALAARLDEQIAAAKETVSKIREKIKGLKEALAPQIDRIGEEQARRTALASREDREATDNEENEGGLSDYKRP
jgi:hypothetical protein